MLDIIDVLNTRPAFAFRSLGYVAMALSLWLPLLGGFTYSEFRTCHYSIAVHFSVVSFWAALSGTPYDLGIETFNVILTLTTGASIYGIVRSSYWHIKKHSAKSRLFFGINSKR